MRASFLLGFVLLALLIAGVTAFVAITSFDSHKLNLSNNSEGAVLQAISFVDPTGDPVDNDFAPTGDPVDNDMAPT
jgi:hypothetical protein